MFRIQLLVAVLLFAIATACQAEDQKPKPWQNPGTQVGQEIIGPDGGKMVWVPAGEFMMGSNDGGTDEQPVHRVRITKGFWLGKYEVTIAQWLHYCRVAKVLLTAEIIVPCTDHPMSGVNWTDYVAYCRFYGLSMPTEAQWEYAARGPEERTYPWGDQWDSARCCNDETKTAEGFTCPVGSFPNGASWCGALDMAGNLSEWCSDWYAEDYYANSSQDDPKGPTTGTERVQRGGYCWGDADECRSARRFGDDPANDGGAGALRVCFTP